MIISNCKINLGLNIISKRDDGYHELDMIIAPISFGDEITIACHDEIGELDFRIKDDLIPIDKSNTVTKAYNEYFGHSNKEKKRVTVYLEKKVPRQAGLGGGSSNAGFLLTELNKKYKFYSKDEMLVIAKKVGADVPFFIDNKTSRVSGIGEKISFLENNIKEKILLVKPTYIGVSTRLAFSLYGENTNELKVSNLDNIEKAIKDGNVLELEKNIENTLEQIVLQNNMKLAKFKVEIESLYGKKFFMSGSGSTFFTFISKQEESEIRKKMNYRISRKYFTRITRFL